MSVRTARVARGGRPACGGGRRFRPGPSGLLLAGALAVTLALVLLALEWVEREDRADFLQRAATVHRALERRIDRQVDLLRGLQGLFDAQADVTRAEFRRYVDRLELARNYPGIQALQYSRRVDDAGRDAFVARMRADRSVDPDGYPGFDIHPPGRRDHYVVVAYNEPMRDNEQAMGFDSAAAAPHAPVTNEARDSGDIAASVPLTLLQRGQPGVALRAPLYRAGVLPATVEARRAAYVGQVSLIVRIAPLMRDVMPPEALGTMRMAVYDVGGDAEPIGSAGARSRLVFDSAATAGPEAGRPGAAGSNQRALMVRVGDRYWEVRFSRPRRPPLTHPLVPSTAAAGGAIALLLYGLTRTLQSQRRRAIELAERMTQQAREHAEQARSVIDSAVDGIVVVDADGVIETANPAIGRMLGLRPAELAGRRLDALIVGAAVPVGASAPADPADPAVPAGGPAPAPALMPMSGPRGRSREALATRSDGGTFPVELTLSESRPSRRGRITCIVRDISERKQAEGAILHMAQHDALTGLPNRVLLQQRFAQESARACAEGRMLAIMLIDVDRFKNVNDLLGHDVGDELLRQVAQRLHRRVRRTDTVARLGGDEFVVLAPQLAHADGAAAIARQLVQEFSEAVDIGGLRLATTLSIGVAMYPADGEDFAALLKRADAAMYAVKGHGRCGFAFASPALSGEIDRRVRIESELRVALDARQFELAYQPVCALDSGARVGCEALLRWRHPQRGLVLPAEFVPVAEESGLIVEIGAWVLQQACAQAAAWHARGHRLRMAVNLSSAQLRDERIVDTVADALARSGLSAGALEVEVTESALMRSPEAAARSLSRLAASGVRVALDDFGTGYSSLDHLRRLPIHRIKIDRSFVEALDGRPEPAALVRAIVALAQGLGLGVTAEGIETDAQRRLLIDYGCTEGQGWLFGHPGPPGAQGAVTAPRSACASSPWPI